MQKKKSGVKKCLEVCAIKGGRGGRRLIANTILNFHFDYLHTSLIITFHINDQSIKYERKKTNFEDEDAVSEVIRSLNQQEREESQCHAQWSRR